MIFEQLDPNNVSIDRLKNPYVDLDTLETLCQSNDVLHNLLNEMFRYCDRYTETVCRFEEVVMSGHSDTRAEIDAIRTTIHDATIDSINILARNLTAQGADSNWIKKLIGNRAAYGKFAVTTAFERLKKGKKDERQ